MPALGEKCHEKFRPAKDGKYILCEYKMLYGQESLIAPIRFAQSNTQRFSTIIFLRREKYFRAFKHMSTMCSGLIVSPIKFENKENVITALNVSSE